MVIDHGQYCQHSQPNVIARRDSTRLCATRIEKTPVLIPHRRSTPTRVGDTLESTVCSDQNRLHVTYVRVE